MPECPSAQSFDDAEVGKNRGVNPAGDVAHRVERGLCASFKAFERLGESGRSVRVLPCDRELDDQRDQLVLDAVVEVTLQPPPLAAAESTSRAWLSVASPCVDRGRMIDGHTFAGSGTCLRVNVLVAR